MKVRLFGPGISAAYVQKRLRAQGLDTYSTVKGMSSEKHCQVNNGLSILLNFQNHAVQGKWSIQESHLTVTPSVFPASAAALDDLSMRKPHTLCSPCFREPATHTQILWSSTLKCYGHQGKMFSNIQPSGVVSDLEAEADHHTKCHQGNKITGQCEKIKLIRTYLKKRVYEEGLLSLLGPRS